jgi:hypothetical protein
MYDRETVLGVAADIIDWQSTAQQLPLADLRTMVTDCQSSLAISLDALNDLFRDHSGHDECTDAIKDAIGDVARQATVTAIFALGLSVRARNVAHHN